MPEPSLGVYVKPRWAWELDSALSSWGSQNAVAGQFSFVALYNDDSLGRSLGVSAVFEAPATANDTLEWRRVSGTVGANTRGGFPLRFDQPSGPGRVYVGTTATLTGDPFMRLGASGSYAAIVMDTPFVVVPPNYSLVLATITTSRTISGVTFWWAPFVDQRRRRGAGTQ